MKILVTGANGQVGNSLVKLLSQMDFEFKALTRHELDISDIEAVNEIIKDYLPDIVINAAAYTAVDKAETDVKLAYKINAEGAKNLALATSSYGAAIFHISTDYVFAGNKIDVYQEEDETNPQGIYGSSKLTGEIDVINSNHRHVIIRTAWVFGEHGNNFVKTMIRLGRDRDQLSIVADQLGGPTYAGDIAQALLKIASQYAELKTLPWGVYHLSGFPYVSWFEFAKEIFDQVEQQGIYTKKIPLLNPIATTDYPTPAQRPKNSRLNCDKIQENYSIFMSDWKSALKNIKSYS